jgi:hypothetical protein
VVERLYTEARGWIAAHPYAENATEDPGDTGLDDA